MEASRLPKMVLLQLRGHAVIEWVHRRLSQSNKSDKIIDALPDNDKDDVLAGYHRIFPQLSSNKGDINLL